MQHDPRPHIRRRRLAVARLRFLSTAAAVAGLAGTAGLGIVAAASWSGDPDATPLPTQNDDSAGEAEPTQPPTTTRQQPASGGFAQPPTVTTPRTGRGGGHAATGGSN